MTVTQAAFDALEAEVLRLRSEMGAYDKDATPWHQRQGQLTDAFTEFAARFADVPGGKLASDIIVARVRAEIGSVGGGASSSAPPVDAATIAALLAGAFDAHFAMDTSQSPPRGYLSIGMSPDFDSQAPLQLGGRVAAEIGGYSNTNKTDGQNKDEPHSNTMVIADNDGGMRWRQYLKYGKKGKVRNTLNRNATITAVDSVGEFCQSVEEVGQMSDGGQMWYVKYDWANRVIRWLAMKPLWTVTLARSQAKYGANDVDVITERQT